MKRLILLILTAALLVLPAAAYCGESAEEKLTFEYSGRGQGLFRLGNTGYLVENCKDWMDRNYANNIRRNAKELNEAVPSGENGIRKYIYFIENSRSVRLDGDLTGENEVYTLIKEYYEADGFATLALETPGEYLDWYYQTDHHWNYKGSYKGYCDLVKMIFGEDAELAVPAETVVFEDMPYSGSYNQKLGYHKTNDLFTVYRFEGLPEYTYTINGSKGTGKYGKMDKFFHGDHKKIAENYYGQFYGGDPGELILDTHQPDKPNLLIISTSFDNPLLHLLTKHYNIIYSVDPRFYKLNMKQDLNVPKIIRKNGIDHVVEVGDIQFFAHAYSLR